MNIDVKKVKIIVTVPPKDLEKVRNAMCSSGAGVIGNYSDCSIISKCNGTYKANDNADPYIGEKNKLIIVEENKLEVICNIDIAKKVVLELRKVHPYEEPSIDIIPLIDDDSLM